MICNNCIYRLGAAYHFKKQCEDSDHRLRVYLGVMDKGYTVRDNETNTDISGPIDPSKFIDIDNDNSEKPKHTKRLIFCLTHCCWNAEHSLTFVVLYSFLWIAAKAEVATERSCLRN